MVPMGKSPRRGLGLEEVGVTSFGSKEVTNKVGQVWAFRGTTELGDNSLYLVVGSRTSPVNGCVDHQIVALHNGVLTTAFESSYSRWGAENERSCWTRFA